MTEAAAQLAVAVSVSIFWICSVVSLIFMVVCFLVLNTVQKYKKKSGKIKRVTKWFTIV